MLCVVQNMYLNSLSVCGVGLGVLDFSRSLTAWGEKLFVILWVLARGFRYRESGFIVIRMFTRSFPPRLLPSRGTGGSLGPRPGQSCLSPWNEKNGRKKVKRLGQNAPILVQDYFMINTIWVYWCIFLQCLKEPYSRWALQVFHLPSIVEDVVADILLVTFKLGTLELRTEQSAQCQ